MGAQPDGRRGPAELGAGWRTQLQGPAYEWALWSSTMRVVTDDPHALPSARRLIDGELAQVELAASRFRPDSEICGLPAGRRTRISATLTAILAAALEAARETRGAVDPTLGHALEAIGYDRDAEETRYSRGLQELGARHGISVQAVTAGRWRGIELDEQARTVVLPRGVRLDLGPTTRAWAADRCAQVVADVLGVGVLVSLGGDIATAGPEGSAGTGGWEILVQDQPTDPAAVVAVPTGLAVATSSTLSREWLAQGREMHHLLDPRSVRPVSREWRSATVVAPDCVTAQTWSTAALVEGAGAPEVLAERGFPVRLVATDGTVRLLGGWPEDAEVGTQGGTETDTGGQDR